MLNMYLYILNHFLNGDSDYILTRIFKFRFFTLIIAITFTTNSLAMDKSVHQSSAWYEWQSFWRQREKVYNVQSCIKKEYVILQDTANQDQFRSPVIKEFDSDSDDYTDN